MTRPRRVTIDVRGDRLDEADESFAVTLSNPWNAQISDGKGIGTIDDDDCWSLTDDQVKPP